MNTRRNILKSIPALIGAAVIPSFGNDEVTNILGYPVRFEEFTTNYLSDHGIIWDQFDYSFNKSYIIGICDGLYKPYHFYLHSVNCTAYGNERAKILANGLAYCCFGNKRAQFLLLDSRLKSVLSQSDFAQVNSPEGMRKLRVFARYAHGMEFS